MTDLIERLRKQADEIAQAGHNGWGNTMTMAADALEAAREENDSLRKVLDYERQRTEATTGRAVKILAGIHAVTYPEIVKLNDGRQFAFNSPLLHEQMQALSDRIRAIPDEIAAIDAARKEGGDD